MRRENTVMTTRNVSWVGRVKGIDDAAVRNLPITSISDQRSLDHLSTGFDRHLWIARLKSPRFPSERKTEAVRRGNERSGYLNSSFAKRLMDSTCCARPPRSRGLGVRRGPFGSALALARYITF